MSYVVYLPKIDSYKDHFCATKGRYKDFYLVRGKVGHGDIPVVTVTPTQADVMRAKADIEQERDEYKNDSNFNFAHSSYKRSVKNTSQSTSAKRKKNKK